MSTTVRWSQLVGQRVVARDSGQLLGSLRRVLLDPEAVVFRVAQLDGGGGGTSIMDWSAIADVATDAIIAINAEAAREPRSEEERQLISGRLDLAGKLVMTEMGDSLGQLQEFEIDLQSGRLLRLHVPGEVVEVERIVTFGPDMLILPVDDDAAADATDAADADEADEPAAATA